MADYNLTNEWADVDTATTNSNNLLPAHVGGTLYSTINVGSLGYAFEDSIPTGDKTHFSNNGVILSSRGVSTSVTHSGYYNTNGQVGNITTSGTVTSYNTSSDPRLKEFKGKPSDADINSKFELLFDTFNTFKWKSDPTGQLVWGFDAHKTIDNGLDMGTEGQGSRNLDLGAKDGNVTVTPAGVDQSKAVPILLSKLEQLERRLKTLEG